MLLLRSVWSAEKSSSEPEAFDEESLEVLGKMESVVVCFDDRLESACCDL